jgi:hypothetical protein
MARNFDNLESFVTFHYEQQRSDHQRLGQRFVNTYIKHPWPDLFYESHDGTAYSLIRQWLADHHYTDTMPLSLDHSASLTGVNGTSRH